MPLAGSKVVAKIVSGSMAPAHDMLPHIHACGAKLMSPLRPGAYLGCLTRSLQCLATPFGSPNLRITEKQRSQRSGYNARKGSGLMWLSDELCVTASSNRPALDQKRWK